MASRATAEQAQESAVALLSIHPQYANAILAGTKRVELRKTPLRANVTHVAIYATRPVQKLVGVFSIDQIDVASPNVLWSRYSGVAGIEREDFDRYFAGREVGVAIGVADVTPFEAPIGLTTLDANLRPPQGVIYLDELAAGRLRRLAAQDVSHHTPSSPKKPTLVGRLLRRTIAVAGGLARAVSGA